ncbi:MAG TPA: NADH-quinone oxidoreductase subunit J [Armatimonadota bacterium]|jgi:NADH:ubiquinone oxidoreductase subunit 6 (subunit J)
MSAQSIMSQAVFALLALVTIGSALQVVATRRIIHAAYWLFPVFAGIAGFYLYLDAQFLAAIQVLIYIGAILVLIIFAVTLTRNAQGDEERQSNRFVLPMALSALVMLVALVGAVLLTPWAPPVSTIDGVLLLPNVPVGEVPAIGVVLLQQYLLPFEITSVLLLAAMVGAIVLARKERPAAPPEQAETEESEPRPARELAGV